jgi:threonine/homoserine/homoserine lactone efflux protein
MALMPNPLLLPVGFVIGVLIALPIGPVNLLGLQRTVERGFLGGVAAGLGIMIGDALIALVAALGVNALSGAISDYRTAIQLIGGLALIGAGAKLLVVMPRFADVREVERSTFADYAWDVPQLFLLTVTNPGAVLGLVAIFGGVSSFMKVSSPVDALALVAAIASGSFCYWVTVSRLISSLRHRLDERRMARINRAAGLVLASFGAVLLCELVLEWFQR